LLIKYIKSLLWKVAKRLSYTEDARCLKVKLRHNDAQDTIAPLGMTRLAGWQDEIANKLQFWP